MAFKTAIAWTDHTFNPWMGCFKVSAGCKYCYADELTTKRMRLNVFGPGAPEGEPTRRQRTKEPWKKVPEWHRAAQAAGEVRRMFCASLADVFEDEVGPNTWRPDVFDLIRRTPWLDWQLLTKRPENLARMLPDDWGDGYPNVWLGTSIEDNRVVERAAALTEVPAVVHFVSYEPAIGPANELAPHLGVALAPADGRSGHRGGVEWVIVGGESGAAWRERRMDLQWARDMQAACADAKTAFFFKQDSGLRTEMGIDALGGVFRDFPLGREPRAHITESSVSALW